MRALLLLVVAGCASIVHGRTQVMRLESSPAGATVHIHGLSATTPVDLAVPRRHPDQDYVVMSSNDRKPSEVIFELTGYEPIVVPIAYGADRWAFWGNMALGGLPGVLVDSGTGAAVVIETPDHSRVIDGIRVDFLTRSVTID